MFFTPLAHHYRIHTSPWGPSTSGWQVEDARREATKEAAFRKQEVLVRTAAELAAIITELPPLLPPSTDGPRTQHGSTIQSELIDRSLWAWTAAAGRTSCVLKGRQNALFGTGREGKVN